MLHLVAGPFLFAAGLCLIYVAVHGMPKLPSFRRAPRPARTVNAFTSGDVLVGEMLTEMMTLREQLAELREQVASGQSRGRRPAKMAS
jgi:hypothetical protein